MYTSFRILSFSNQALKFKKGTRFNYTFSAKFKSNCEFLICIISCKNIFTVISRLGFEPESKEYCWSNSMAVQSHCSCHGSHPENADTKLWCQFYSYTDCSSCKSNICFAFMYNLFLLEFKTFNELTE